MLIPLPRRLTRLGRRLHRLAVRSAREESGVATIEFVFMVPLLVIFVYASAEFVNAYDNRNKVVALTRTLADLTSQGDSSNPMSQTLMSDIIASANPILAPFAASKATMKISAIGVYSFLGKQSGYVCSSYPSADVLPRLTRSGSLVVPTNFQRDGARYMMAEVSMPYEPLFSTFLKRFIKTWKFSYTWSETVTWPVRGGQSYGLNSDNEVVLPNGLICPPNLLGLANLSTLTSLLKP